MSVRESRKLSDLPSPLALARFFARWQCPVPPSLPPAAGRGRGRWCSGGRAAYLTSSAVTVVCAPRPNANRANLKRRRRTRSILPFLPSLEVSVSDFEVVVNSVRRAEGRLTAARPARARPRLSLALGFTVALHWPSPLLPTLSLSLSRHLSLSLQVL